MDNELETILQDSKRKMIVCENELDLTQKYNNVIFILMIEESHGSAGGRGGGSGSRRLNKIIGFNINQEENEKIYETDKKDEIELFDIPYSAVAMDIVLKSGKSLVVQGLVDNEMTRSYLNLIKNFI